MTPIPHRKFVLRKDTIKRLGIDELADVRGAGLEACSASCCLGCDTDFSIYTDGGTFCTPCQACGDTGGPP